ncbi:response regulator transcription factor [Deinococcus cellulosilyticus]|uniref:DNA-binding response regulator n=1 Tax=Deinococcus cellulosilyticus (strain DSM 18568 / NBRC 106333 / KACC 11606 / 5516J-15) TaxID=1223518 RepID=A0A511N8I2_DEIC1|nr:response regulator transcription factor [Deinococcus cellulosilyticus]GEM49153.1 DNA-binding response regulator [Deinococcus cellulosilyticus NBRC 106333 = KACC 11606]
MKGISVTAKMWGVKVLIIDDEQKLGGLLAENLQEFGLEVKVWPTGEGALEQFHLFKPDLVVLDVMLPGVDGFTLCRKIRQESLTPIIMLTSRSAENDRIVGLELGADDYVVKPFSLRELVARVRTQLRRQEALRQVQASPGRRLSVLDCTVDLDGRTVQVKGAPVEVTRREFELLHCLMEHPGRVFTRNQLIERVWGGQFEGFDRSVDALVRRLKEHLGKGALLSGAIVAVRGVGYKLQP